jgi:hypothetical protein
MANVVMNTINGRVQVLGVDREFTFMGGRLQIDCRTVEEAIAILNALPSGKPMTLHGSDNFTAPVEAIKSAAPATSNSSNVVINAKTQESAKKEIADAPELAKALDVPLPLLQAKSLRDVVGILLEKTKNPNELVKLCSDMRDKIPALHLVDPANLDARVRRAADVLLDASAR